MELITYNRKRQPLRLILVLLLLVIGFGLFVNHAIAITNIDSTNRWAWNDIRGWIDLYAPLTVELSATKLTGFAVFEDTASDWISFDCAAAPHASSSNGLPTSSICGPSNYSVSHDGAGNLSGWAWNDGIGWISFCGGLGTSDCPGTVDYQVTVDPVSGDFHGYAWNDTIGWISFNCLEPGFCGTPYKVNTNYFATAPATGYLISNTFDTGVVGGVAYNSIVWQGTLSPGNSSVSFQLATSNDDSGWGSGSADYLGPGGSSGIADVYTGAPNQSIQLIPEWHNNRRYYRYKMYINKDTGEEAPIVEDVVVNWSP